MTKNDFNICFHIDSYNFKVAYCNTFSNNVELLDVTGGYGQPNILNIAGYISSDWIFGQDVFDYSFVPNMFVTNNLINDVVHSKIYNIDDIQILSSEIFKQLLNFYKRNLLDINPNANFKEIYIILDEINDIKNVEKCFEEVFCNSKILIKQKISCIVKNYEKNKVDFLNKSVTLIDLNNTTLNIYKLKVLDDINIINDYSNKNLSLNKIYELLTIYIKNMCINEGYQNVDDFEIKKFVIENKYRIFHKNVFKKGIKLYFNFVSNPFYKIINEQVIQEVFKQYISELQKQLNILEDDFYIVSGDGFDIEFIKQIFYNYFEDKQIEFKSNNNNCYNVVFGGLYNSNKKVINIARIKSIAGFKNGETFVPLVEEDNYTQKNYIIYDYENHNYSLDLYLKKNKKIRHIKKINLKKLPKRAKGTLRLKVCADFKGSILKLTFEDMGFGQFYVKTEYKQNFVINLES